MHQGSARDNYITINMDNIDPSKANNGTGKGGGGGKGGGLEREGEGKREENRWTSRKNGNSVRKC